MYLGLVAALAAWYNEKKHSYTRQYYNIERKEKENTSKLE